MTTVLSNDWTIPDAELFHTRFPQFQSVPEQHITFLIDEMSDHVGGLEAPERWRDQDYQPAIMYLVAHVLTMEGEPARSDAIAGASGSPVTGGVSVASGPVQKVEVGDVKTWFDTSRSGTAGIDSNALAGMGEDRLNFSLTHYGRMFMRLREKNFGGPRVFVP